MNEPIHAEDSIHATACSVSGERITLTLWCGSAGAAYALYSALARAIGRGELHMVMQKRNDASSAA